MNSRERVEAALRFEEPDRVPIDLAGMRSTGIHVFALAELRRSLGLEARRIYLYDPHQMLGFPEDDLRERLHADVIGLEEPRRDPGSGSWSPWSPREGAEVLIPSDVRPERDGGDSWVLRNARVAHEAVTRLHLGLPVNNPGVGRLHGLGEGLRCRLGRIEELNLHGYHLLVL